MQRGESSAEAMRHAHEDYAPRQSRRDFFDWVRLCSSSDFNSGQRQIYAAAMRLAFLSTEKTNEETSERLDSVRDKIEEKMPDSDEARDFYEPILQAVDCVKKE
jgi:hypothetical protein